jgi:hypothetical protein
MPVELHDIPEPSVHLNTIERYLAGFELDTQRMIGNVQTQLKMLSATGITLPVSINQTEYDNSYVCSPYTALVPYALQEIDKVDSAMCRGLVKALLPMFGGYLKRKHINRIVHVNNWLLSTNLYPTGLDDRFVQQTTQLIIDRFPAHAIVFRSLNPTTNTHLLGHLERHGYLLVPSRQIYLYDQPLEHINKSYDYKHDQRLLRSTPYRCCSQAQLHEDDIPRIVELYNMLYLDKYSYHNPQFTQAYIQHIMHSDCFEFFGFRDDDGRLVAVGGLFSLGENCTMPIVGYDTTHPIREGLYRLICITALNKAYEQGKLLNASSGAAQFKRMRGARTSIEYSAVYIQHLPKETQRMWAIVAKILKKWVVPMIQKHRL